MIRRPPRSTRTYTLFPYTTLFRSQDLDQVGEELHVCLVAIALERIEPGRPAVLQRQVVAAARPDEDLRAPVLVEEENRRRRLELLHLAQQEVDQCGLAGTGLADDHGVGDRLLPEGVLTGGGGVEVEVVRLAIGGQIGRASCRERVCQYV